MRKLILYISCSLDGYIAKPGNDLTFLDIVQKGGEDYGYKNFVDTVDTVILGRRTYDWVLNSGFEFPHQDKACYVITSRHLPPEGNIVFYNGDLTSLVNHLKATDGKNIFCDGGSEIVNQLLKDKLFDEMIISVIPVLVGDGVRLFKDPIPEQRLELRSVKHFDTGLVQLHYFLKMEESRQRHAEVL
jgi:dihydrofolate reductase